MKTIVFFASFFCLAQFSHAQLSADGQEKHASSTQTESLAALQVVQFNIPLLGQFELTTADSTLKETAKLLKESAKPTPKATMPKPVVLVPAKTKTTVEDSLVQVVE